MRLSTAPTLNWGRSRGVLLVVQGAHPTMTMPTMAASCSSSRPSIPEGPDPGSWTGGATCASHTWSSSSKYPYSKVNSLLMRWHQPVS